MRSPRISFLLLLGIIFGSSILLALSCPAHAISVDIIIPESDPVEVPVGGQAMRCTTELRVALVMALGYLLATPAPALASRPAGDILDISPIARDIQQQIEQARTPAQIAPLLEHRSDAVQVAAVRRLKQMGSDEVTELLVARFWKEEPHSGARLVPQGMRQIVKNEIIEALGEIGTERAKSAVLDILQRYVDRGPSIFPHIYYDAEYTGVVMEAIRAFSRWLSDPKVYGIIRNIGLHGSERKFGWGMRQEAYKGLLAEEMRRQNVSTLPARVGFLLERMTGAGAGHKHDWVEGKSGLKTLEALKNGAIGQSLVSYGTAIVPLLHEELRALPEGEKREGIENVIRSIEVREKAARERAEAARNEGK